MGTGVCGADRMTASTPVPQAPFATALALKILKIVQTRDLDLLELRGKQEKLGREAFVTALGDLDARTYDDIYAACENVLKTADGVVANVLRVQQQMNEIRAAEAALIGKRGD